MKILLADDEPDIRRIAEMVLSALGEVEILNASSGQEALVMVGEQRPNLVLLDVMMPGLDGVSTLQSLKADPTTRSVPVIIMTARASRADQARYFLQGAADVVVKPFDPPQLLARAKRILKGAAPAANDGFEAQLATLKTAFIQRLPRQLDQLDVLIGTTLGTPVEEEQRRHAETAAREAHRLRGTAGSYRLETFADLMGHIEDLLGHTGALDREGLSKGMQAARQALTSSPSSPR